MKKYSVWVKFKNGKDLSFETDSNIQELEPITLHNGIRMLVTENEYALNIDWIKEVYIMPMQQHLM